jgi:ATP-dependent Clp protease ATP-binding subunit ClpA
MALITTIRATDLKLLQKLIKKDKSLKRAFQALITLINLTYYYFDKDTV